MPPDVSTRPKLQKRNVPPCEKRGATAGYPATPPWVGAPLARGVVRCKAGVFGLNASQRKHRESRRRTTSPTRRYRMAYVVKGIDPEQYRSSFGLPDEELEKRGIVRMTVTEKPSFPCRVSLTDRDI